MAKSKKSKTTRTRTRKKNKVTKPKADIIFLHAADTRLAIRTTQRILDYGSKKSQQLYEQLGISLDQPVIAIYPYPSSPRVDLVKHLAKIKGAVVLVIGLDVDKKNKALQSYYKYAQGIWLHPMEKQFHVDMMNKGNALSFQQAEEKLQEWRPFLEKHFGDNFKIIRNG